MKNNAAALRTRRFLKAIRGANLVEYIILVGMMAVLCLFAFQKFGSTVQTKVTNQDTAIQSVNDKAGP